MGLAALLPIIGPAVQKLLDLIPDPNARAKAEADYNRELLQIAAQSEADQRGTNKVEAQHSSIFVAGWRPAIGWVCAAALAFNYLVRPLWVWCIAVWYPGAPIPPSLDDNLWQLMTGMLGMGALRTLDKRRNP